MSILRASMLAGSLLAGFAGSALAADMPIAPPPPPPPHVGGWYLRGDIGFTNQRVDSLDTPGYAAANDLDHVSKHFDSSAFGGLGIGYRVNNWLRFDVTGEYRSSANYKGTDTFNFFDPTLGQTDGTDTYNASKYEWTGLLNAYLDLGTWRGFTPFVGAGIGMSRNTIANYTDSGYFVSTNNGGFSSFAYADGSRSKWNFAWALQAGVAYALTDRVSLEFAYRYIDLGDAETGQIYDASGNSAGRMKFKDLTSNDFKVGIRYALDAPAAMPAEPLYIPPACPGVCK